MYSNVRTLRPLLTLLVAALTLFSTAQAQTLNVTLLGTGDPIPCLDRFGPATLVEAGGHQMLDAVPPSDSGNSVLRWVTLTSCLSLISITTI
jgi:hypothetical protein